MPSGMRLGIWRCLQSCNTEAAIVRHLGSASSPKAASKPESSFKDTVMVPRTDFPMRANAIKREPGLRDNSQAKLYHWQIKRSQLPVWELHDGPPYANGKLHIGHALNKSLKDIFCRYKVIRGHRVRVVPGWDCHGLPIEMAAIKNIPAELHGNTESIRDAAKSLSAATVVSQAEDMKEWGLMMDFDHCYKTTDPAFESSELRVLGTLVDKELIRRGTRPVHWSPATQTALAEAELEYEDNHKSLSVYVRFQVSNPNQCFSGLLKELGGSDSIYFLAWTTTPWTLPANRALCVHADEEYEAVRGPGGAYIVMASERHSLPTIGLEDHVMATFKGSDLLDVSYSHPLQGECPASDDAECIVLHGDHVEKGTGTGVVHTAPGHGFEDYEVCEAHGGIKINVSPVDDSGRFSEAAGEDLVGRDVLGEGSSIVIKKLKSTGAYVFSQPYFHRYPYDWRAKKPVIVRVTDQWFVDLSPIRSKAASELKSVKMFPPKSVQRISQMVSRRVQWCISRQRSWGVPIPAFRNRETGEIVLTAESIEHFADIVSRHGCNAWWNHPVKSLLPPSLKSDAKNFEKMTDTLDVWFDSGSSWSSVVYPGKESSYSYPFNEEKSVADLYLEGSDQHRGWFQSSLLTSVAVTNQAPYKHLVTHGFVLDGEGKKMSKSLGNVVDPTLIIQGNGSRQWPGYGVDLMRYWLASTDWSADISVSPEILKKCSEGVRRLRNGLKFMIGSLNGFDPAVDALPYSALRKVDQFAIGKLSSLDTEVRQAYESYNTAKVLSLLQNTLSNDLSSIYFESVKDVLYCDSILNSRRRAVQTVVWRALLTVTQSAAPVLPHLAEDVYNHAPELFKLDRYIKHDASMTDTPSFFGHSWALPSVCVKGDADQFPHVMLQSIKHIDQVLPIRSSVMKIFEELRQAGKISSSGETCIVMQAKVLKEEDALNSIVELTATGELSQICGVSGTVLLNSAGDKPLSSDWKDFKSLATQSVLGESVLEMPEGSQLNISIRRPNSSRCARCRLHTAPLESGLCNRCEQAVNDYLAAQKL